MILTANNKENKMRLKFVTVQERANSLGLGVSKFRYVGVDSNGEKVRYNYRLFIANKEEAEDIKKEADRFKWRLENGFQNSGVFGNGNMLPIRHDIVEADYMSLIALACAIEGFAIAGFDGLGIAEDYQRITETFEKDKYGCLIWEDYKKLFTTGFPIDTEEMEEDRYCNDADISGSALAQIVRKQYQKTGETK